MIFNTAILSNEGKNDEISVFVMDVIGCGPEVTYYPTLDGAAETITLEYGKSVTVHPAVGTDLFMYYDWGGPASGQPAAMAAGDVEYAPQTRAKTSDTYTFKVNGSGVALVYNAATM